MIRVGIDTGGTFTDFVVLAAGRLRVHKVLSTPAAPEQAILTGLRDLGLDFSRLRLVHGSTVATNAVLESKGVPTAYVTNRGFGDVLTIGRQARPELYNLQPEPISPPVPPAHCFETGGRVAADGRVLEPLTEADIAALVEQVRAASPRAVAINLLFSYLDDAAERALEAALEPFFFVARSSAVLPEIREYERGMATFLNAYVGPLVDGYLARLATAVTPAPVAVMQSAGGTVGAGQAGRQGVHLLLSGPAGGLMGARFIGKASGFTRLLTFDMGGTSTDVALIDGAPRLTTEGRIGRYPVAVPMVDMHTIGAGGGSIAQVDAGGLLQVGPASAGADPGPACYGRGGRLPTVTDANLVLGRLRADAFLGGALQLDVAAAETALQRLADAMRIPIEEAAAGVVRLANEHMARALRVISVQRGIDPADFVLASFGGAGGLHVCALADGLRMRRALVPVHAGVLSALGMLVAPRARQLSRGMSGLLSALPPETIEHGLAALRDAGVAALISDGIAANDCSSTSDLDLRYLGQSYTLTVPWQGTAATAAAFHARHEARYGHRLDTDVELVNLRVAVQGPLPQVSLPSPSPVARTEVRTTRLYGIDNPVPVFPRECLAEGECLNGPALITETVATTYLAPGWQCRVDAVGNLVLERPLQCGVR